MWTSAKDLLLKDERLYFVLIYLVVMFMLCDWYDKTGIAFIGSKQYVSTSDASTNTSTKTQSPFTVKASPYWTKQM